MTKNDWTKVESSDGESFQYEGCPSMRKIKADLMITNRRLVKVSHFGQWAIYRLSGTPYTFTVTVCY
jgi:hypothetical protein